MRKKIIGVTIMLSVLTILCAQSAVALVNTVTDKPQYNLGEKGKLKISILNEYSKPVSIYNITIIYPWYSYDANKDEWSGNATIKGDSSILVTMTEKGTDGDHYYKEAEFTVPKDGTYATLGSQIYYKIWTSEQQIERYVSINVAVPSTGAIAGFDMWMMSLIAAVVVCTIILAIVIFLATRGARASMPRVPASPRAKA